MIRSSLRRRIKHDVAIIDNHQLIGLLGGKMTVNLEGNITQIT